MQAVVAHALGWHSHQVQVECRRMGGGFGGKESQSALFACVSAICAVRLRRPVKLRLDRDDDFMITGKRHGFYYEYDVGFDDDGRRSEAHTSELQSLMRSSYAVLCLKQTKSSNIKQTRIAL